MKLYTQHLPASSQPDAVTSPDASEATLSLNWDTRQKSRFRATLTTGEDIGVDVPRGQPLRHGAILTTAQGERLRIEAAPQSVLQVTATSGFDLLKAAYHLGNRHVPLMLTPDALYLEPDHVLADMLRGLGLQVGQTVHPFEPESGAYHQHEHRLKPLHGR